MASMVTDFSEVTLSQEQRHNLLTELAAYADTDLLCYFADDSQLYARQVRLWEPVLRDLEAKWGLQIARTKGVMPIAQPSELKQICEAFLIQYDDAALVAMAQVVTRLGSVLLAIALQLGLVSVDAALAAAALDEGYQAEEWGADADIAQRLEHRAEKVQMAQAYLTANSSSGRA